MSESTNAEFAVDNYEFAKACKLANVPRTKRQASKFRRKQGLAYKALRFVQINNLQNYEDQDLVHAQLSFAGLRKGGA